MFPRSLLSLNGIVPAVILRSETENLLTYKIQYDYALRFSGGLGAAKGALMRAAASTQTFDGYHLFQHANHQHARRKHGGAAPNFATAELAFHTVSNNPATKLLELSPPCPRSTLNFADGNGVIARRDLKRVWDT